MRVPPLARNFFIFMQFSGKIGQIIGWRPPSGLGAPSSGKSWIRHWYWILIFLVLYIASILTWTLCWILRENLCQENKSDVNLNNQSSLTSILFCNSFALWYKLYNESIIRREETNSFCWLSYADREEVAPNGPRIEQCTRQRSVHPQTLRKLPLQTTNLREKNR